MNELLSRLNFDNSTKYHYGKFPPSELEWKQIIRPMRAAAAALARYDQMLLGMHNSEVLLAPLRGQEAVISSRMEGTISTLDEILSIEAAQDGDDSFLNARHEGVEVYLYTRALKNAQQAMEGGAPISDHLIRSAHAVLLGFGRGAKKSPGSYKDEPNYVVDKSGKNVLFEPILPTQLQSGLDSLFNFIEENDGQYDELLRTAIGHIEFEALHPFKDGNGRIGRMLVTLMLWDKQLISKPHFYISPYLEANRNEYIDRMRAVSENGAWTEWCIFFLNAIEKQAEEHIQTAQKISDLYAEMKNIFIDLLSSKQSVKALDFIFANPIFRNTILSSQTDIPSYTANRFTRLLCEEGLLDILKPASGRRPALLAFEPLLRIVRG